MNAPSTHHTFYVSQSGSYKGGYVTYGWIEAPGDRWGELMTHWAEFRRDLYRRHHIPADADLRSALRYSPESGDKSSAISRKRHALADAMKALTANPEVTVGSVWTTAHTPAEFAIERPALYAGLVEMLDSRLAVNGHTGMVFVDGDATDPQFYRAHRRLGFQRNLIEDPIFVAERRTMGGEMSDLVAWTAYQYLTRMNEPDFYWDLYADLRPIDVHGEPLPLDTEGYERTRRTADAGRVRTNTITGAASTTR